MQFNPFYPSISLDSIANAATYFSGQWSKDLKRNQSQQVLILIITKFYWQCKENIFRGNPFHARTRASHAALSASLGLTREWTCKLIARLREAKWITTYAPRRLDGKLREITIFRPGGKLKKLLIMLLKSTQRPHPSHVNSSSQKIPTSKISQADVEKNLQSLQKLREDVAQKLGMKT
jgi:hypothetical protein